MWLQLQKRDFTIKWFKLMHGTTVIVWQIIFNKCYLMNKVFNPVLAFIRAKLSTVGPGKQI